MEEPDTYTPSLHTLCDTRQGEDMIFTLMQSLRLCTPGVRHLFYCHFRISPYALEA